MKKFFVIVLVVVSIPALAQFQTAKALIASWEKSWNSYDLNEVVRLFVNDTTVTYFSSERPGMISGLDSLQAHHRRFGFVPGGKTSESKLWLSEVRYRKSFVTATWHFKKPGAAEQRGPVTFFLKQGPSGFRIQHAHFSNDPKGG